MSDTPYIFLHGGIHQWKAGTDPALHKLSTLNDAPKELLPSLAINVSNPDILRAWLEANDAALITDLYIHLDGRTPSNPGDASFFRNNAPTPQQWCLLFDQVKDKATNLRSLSVYWDAEGPWGTPRPWKLSDLFGVGMGRSVVFIRGLAQLKVKESVEIDGWYAKHWPKYLEENMGLKPLEKMLFSSGRELQLRDYQEGTERLDPWKGNEDRFNFF